MNRRIPIIAGSLFLAGAGVYLYASRVEARNYKLESVRVNTYGSLSAGSGDNEPQIFRILHLSDLHLSYPESHKIQFLQQITDADYDLVVLTGDIFEDYTGLQYANSMLSRRPRLGAYAVLGNHDYYNYSLFNKFFGRLNRRFRHPAQYRDVEPMVDALTRGGYEVLRNQSHTHREGVHVVGIDYPGIKLDALCELTAEAPPGHLILTLFHVPKRLHHMEEAGVHLAVGGHTHGGQIRLPGIGALITDSELKRQEASGLIYRGSTAFHISRGVSADPRTNFRLFCPPAATIIEAVHHARSVTGRQKADAIGLV